MYEQKNEQSQYQQRHEIKQPICYTTKIDGPQQSQLITQQLDPNLMETSFENNLSEEHANAIWNSSIQFLRASLKNKFDDVKGFNDADIFEISMELKDSIWEPNQYIQILNDNQILTYEQKKDMISILKNYTHLCRLLQRLSCMFCETIFKQLTVLIYQSAIHYKNYKQTLKLTNEFKKFLAPRFSNIDVNNLKIPLSIQHYEVQKDSQISQNAQQAGIQIAGSYFITTKICYLNLKQIDAQTNNNNIVRAQFQKFVSVIAKGVYLCAEGCFQHPYQTNNNSILSMNLNQSHSISQEISFTDDNDHNSQEYQGEREGEDNQNVNKNKNNCNVGVRKRRNC